jgi:hypothetical protein
MKKLARLTLAAFLCCVGIILASTMRDMYALEGARAALGPALMMVGVLTVAAVLILWRS